MAHSSPPRTPTGSPALESDLCDSLDRPIRRSIDSDTPFTPTKQSSTASSLQNSPITPQDAFSTRNSSHRPQTRIDEVCSKSRQLQEQTDSVLREVEDRAPILVFQRAGLFGGLQIGETIGRGQWSKVHRAWVREGRTEFSEEQAKAGSKVFAAKVADGKLAVKVIRNEARILTHLGSRDGSVSRIVGFYGYDINHNALVLEYLAPPRSTNLMAGLNECPSALLGIATKLIDGLELIHEANVIHGDIKPDNIFLRRLHSGNGHVAAFQPVYCDFSASRFDLPGAVPTESGGTYDFMAPELFATSSAGSFPTKESDVYSLGMTLVYAAAGQSPFDSAANSIARRAMAMQGTPLEFLASNLYAWQRFETSGLRPMVQNALAKNPRDRYTAKEWNEWLCLAPSVSLTAARLSWSSE